MEGNKDNDRKEIFSERVRAGKRTYFFDVKATRANDYYLTITESKRRYNDDNYTYEKHKIFLYKEDFNKFVKALNATVDHVKEELLPEVDFDKFDREREEAYLAKNNGAPAVPADVTENVSDEAVDEPVVDSDEPAVDSDEQPAPESETSAIESELKWD
ncbi:MAG: hypothetical protein DRI71_09170 [Bacteroidetes bacterium]|nr:MAG: hypothetical protein DRI71_09170 [Bacteroidota bacterium]